MFNKIKLGFFLAVRFVARTSKWTSGFIVFVMTLTFINLVVINGILVGLIEGSVQGYRNVLTGDVYISAKDIDPYIREDAIIEGALNSSPYVKGYTRRVFTNVEALQEDDKYRILDEGETEKFVSANLIGINVDEEKSVTGLHTRVIKGSFLDEGDTGWVVIGSALLEEYSPFASDFAVFEDVDIGSSVYIRYPSGFEKKYRIKGITRAKNDLFDLSILTTNKELKQYLGRQGNGTTAISIRANSPDQDEILKESLLAVGVDEHAKVETSEEVIGVYINDIRNTFFLLGTVVGTISLVAAAITLFVVIFITAITRRKFIGMLKGIGVPPESIRMSYVFLALFYGVAGILIGFIVTYTLIVPYFAENPIDFPFSDGILYAPLLGTFIRSVIILIAAGLAGLIPAWMIVRQNTLDAILGR